MSRIRFPSLVHFLTLSPSVNVVATPSRNEFMEKCEANVAGEVADELPMLRLY